MKQSPARTPLHVTITRASGRLLRSDHIGERRHRNVETANGHMHVEPLAPGSGTFAAATAERLRRMLRLHADLGVNLTGAAIIVDLLERLERVEAELAHPRPNR